MTWVQFRIGLPEGTWLADVSREHPDTTFRLLGVVAEDGVGYALVTVVAERREAVLDELKSHEGVDHVDLLGDEEYESTVHVTGEVPRFIAAARRSGLPVEPPVEVVDGGADLGVAGDHDRLSALGRELAAADVAFDVELVGRYDDATSILTEAQRDLVLAAIEEGYYDTPRRCTLTELAETHGIAKSTCSETLQRAEEKLMKRFVEELPAARVERETDGASEDEPERKREVVA